MAQCETSCDSNGLEIYVDVSVASSGTGTCWGSAKKYLREALALASAHGTTIYVAQGTYRPDQGLGATADERSETFSIPEIVITIRGGYRGSSSAGNPCDRDLEAFETILTGEIGSASLVSDNSKHVLTAVSASPGNPTSSLTTLDGLTVEGGYNEEEADPGEPEPCLGQPVPRGGAGLHWRQRCVEVRDCVFRNHFVRGGGGAIRAICPLGDSAIVRCVFEKNQAYKPAVGVSVPLACEGTPSSWTDLPVAGDGGAVWVLECGQIRVDSCVFLCNFSAHVGGGLQLQGGGSPVVTNCVFLGNLTRDWGGGLRSGFDTYATIVNCTIAGNRAKGQGAGLAIKRADGGTNDGYVHVLNCVLWDNRLLTSSTNGQQVYVDAADDCQVTLTTCDIGNDFATPPTGSDVSPTPSAAGPVVGNGLFNANPQFLSQPSGSALWGTGTDDVHLEHNGLEKSPCVDAGAQQIPYPPTQCPAPLVSPPAFPGDQTNLDGDSSTSEALSRDLDGVNRFARLEVDVGAYESVYCAADLDGDDSVGPADLGILLGGWGTCQSPCSSDIITDNVVDGADLGALLAAWGSCSSSNSFFEMSSGRAVVPTGVFASLGFSSIEEFVEWITALGEEQMSNWFNVVFGGSGGSSP